MLEPDTKGNQSLSSATFSCFRVTFSVESTEQTLTLLLRSCYSSKLWEDIDRVREEAAARSLPLTHHLAIKRHLGLNLMAAS